jgi:hypothetical protein
VHLLQSRTDETIIWLEKARNATPAYPGIRAWLASALNGEAERAAAELNEARRLSDGRYSSIARLRDVRYWGVPKIGALFETPVCARPGCRRNDRDPPPRHRCGLNVSCGSRAAVLRLHQRVSFTAASRLFTGSIVAFAVP